MPKKIIDEIPEVNADEVIEITDDPNSDVVDLSGMSGNQAVPPLSDLDHWFAQLAHGYCPPETTSFNRHTPPTTMPGKV